MTHTLSLFSCIGTLLCGKDLCELFTEILATGRGIFGDLVFGTTSAPVAVASGFLLFGGKWSCWRNIECFLLATAANEMSATTIERQEIPLCRRAVRGDRGARTTRSRFFRALSFAVFENRVGNLFFGTPYLSCTDKLFSALIFLQLIFHFCQCSFKMVPTISFSALIEGKKGLIGLIDMLFYRPCHG